MTELDVKQEAQEALRYFDLDANAMGTKDNQLANLINSYDARNAGKQANLELGQGVLRPRHNVDAAFAAVEEKIKRRRGLYDPNATVASNSEKFKSEDKHTPPTDEPKTADSAIKLPEGWSLIAKEDSRV